MGSTRVQPGVNLHRPTMALTKLNGCVRPMAPNIQTPVPNDMAETNVPANANKLILPRLRKKGSASRVYPLWNMIGGSRNRKKNSVQ